MDLSNAKFGRVPDCFGTGMKLIDPLHTFEALE